MDLLDDLYLPYMFDISIFDKIDNQNLKDHINRVGQVFYQRDLQQDNITDILEEENK